MRASTRAGIVVTYLVLTTTALFAASLQVSPVSVELMAPGAAATITLRNEASAPLNAQVRVFRWVQGADGERLEPTQDVVASPPITTLAPRTDYTVRIVRVAKRPITSGEAYRLLVDEIPEHKIRPSGAIAFVMRYSIPVFFYSRGVSGARLRWSVDEHGKVIDVTVTNNGDRHARISGLTIRNKEGLIKSFGKGLTGYVLARSSMRWQVRSIGGRLRSRSPIVISAQSDTGPIHATLAVHRSR